MLYNTADFQEGNTYFFEVGKKWLYVKTADIDFCNKVNEIAKPYMGR